MDSKDTKAPQVSTGKVHTTIINTTTAFGDVQVDVTDWLNMEGLTIAVTGRKDGITLLLASLTHDEADALVMALQAHKLT